MRWQRRKRRGAHQGWVHRLTVHGARGVSNRLRWAGLSYRGVPGLFGFLSETGALRFTGLSFFLAPAQRLHHRSAWRRMR